jgi:hypothetical protein
MEEKWKGIFKVLEEMGELQQVLGKLCVFPDGKHPDGTDLIRRLEEEVVDVTAALAYFVENTPVPLNGEHMDKRMIDKYEKFNAYSLSGVPYDVKWD